MSGETCPGENMSRRKYPDSSITMFANSKRSEQRKDGVKL